MDIRSTFITWYYNIFQIDDLYARMSEVSEASKWHRERTVATHTDMVVAQYIALSDAEWTSNTLAGAFACAFHDVGKPSCRVEKWKEERGTYWAYSGHEQASARLWEDYIARNWKVLSELFELTVDSIYVIGWLVENHRPWGTKKEAKLNQLAYTVNEYISFNVFKNVLMADNWGRIGDTQEENQAESMKWIDAFEARCANVDWQPTESDKALLILIGASGSGKSTFTNNNIDSTYVRYSLDELRIRWYSNDYNEAFKLSCEDKKFNGKAQREYIDLLKSGVSVVVDNTNVSAKRRAFYINEARRHGYQVGAVIFPIDLDTVINRQTTRTDKTVPNDAVTRQYKGISYPSLGETDIVIIYDGNLI